MSSVIVCLDFEDRRYKEKRAEKYVLLCVSEREVKTE